MGKKKKKRRKKKENEVQAKLDNGNEKYKKKPGLVTDISRQLENPS